MSLELENSENARCIIIGASHGGISCAFALRQFGWKGQIDVYDELTSFPHQKPPLSKDFLLGKSSDAMMQLKPEKAYEKFKIHLHLGVSVTKIDPDNSCIVVGDEVHPYHKLVIATGASAFIPPFNGLDRASNVFTIRHKPDSEALKACIDTYEKQGKKPDIVVVGAGYIGLEAAASLNKFGAKVTVIEREERVLQRVTAPVMSEFFTRLHGDNGVKILTSKQVASITQDEGNQFICCEDGDRYKADIVLVGVGVRVNQSLAEDAGLKVDNGICVNKQCQTSHANVYAIGDCSYHHSTLYNRQLRLESVQNAMDQANVTAMHICGKETEYNKIPWFWSDQYDAKLQIVGLLNDYTDVVVRHDSENPKSISAWYFQNERLISVDAVNQPKAYMLGTKLIPSNAKINKAAIADLDTPLTADAITIN